MKRELGKKKLRLIISISIAFLFIFFIQRLFVNIEINSTAIDYWRFAHERSAIGTWLWWDTLSFYTLTFFSGLIGSFIIMNPKYKFKQQIIVSFFVITFALMPTMIIFLTQLGGYHSPIAIFYDKRYLMTILLFLSGYFGLIVIAYIKYQIKLKKDKD